MPQRDRYLTDEYVEKLESLARSTTDHSPEAVRREYLEACEEFEEFFRDDAPLAVVRRTAFRKTKSTLGT